MSVYWNSPLCRSPTLSVANGGQHLRLLGPKRDLSYPRRKLSLMSGCNYGRVGVDFLVADSRQSGTAKRQKSSDAKLERDGWVDGLMGMIVLIGGRPEIGRVSVVGSTCRHLVHRQQKVLPGTRALEATCLCPVNR